MYLLNNHTWFFNFSNFLNGPKRALHPKCPFEPLKNFEKFEKLFDNQK